MNNTIEQPSAYPAVGTVQYLDANKLEESAHEAAAAFVAAGTAANTARSYKSALSYLSGWLGANRENGKNRTLGFSGQP